MAIITNIDKLRISEIEENLANDKVLTIDSTGLVAWKNQDEITPDLSAYYTKSEIDALLENISYNDLLDVPTNLSDFNNDEGFITISDVPSYISGDGIDITNSEIRIKQSVLDEINANTNKTLSDVTSKGNVTNAKIKGSEVFSNTMREDYAQIKDVNDSGWGLLPLQSEMKIALMAKDGTTVLSEADLSWLATGDLAITIDDTDPENPELVFTQGGLEVARIPASTLLTGVARSADLSGYKIQFKDGANTVVYSVDLQALLDAKQDKLTATGDVVISGSSLIDLKQSVKSDIAKGVTAESWGNHEGKYVGLGSDNAGFSYELFSGDLLETEAGNYTMAVSVESTNAPSGIGSPRSLFSFGARSSSINSTNSSILVGTSGMAFKNRTNNVWRVVWDTENLPNPATETYVDNAITAIPDVDLSDYYTIEESDLAYAPATGYPDWAQELEDLLNF